MKDWNDYRNILAIRLDNAGDVLMTEPALRALKESFPARLTLLASRQGAAAAAVISEIDHCLTAEVPWMGPASLGSTSRAIEEIRRRSFDAAVIFTNFSQSAFPAALMCHLAGIKDILAYCREKPFSLITRPVYDSEPFTPPRHGVVRQLDLVRTVGADVEDDTIRISIPEATRSRTKSLLEERGISIKNFILLHPGASDAKRRFSLSRYAAAIRVLRQKTGLPVVITGNSSERVSAESLAERLGKGVLSLAGTTSFEEFCALIDAAQLLVSNNTGSVHIAAATSTPVVVLYARTNPEHTPWKVPSRILYFDIKEEQRTKNPLLLFLLPKEKSPLPTSDDIVRAALELLDRAKKSDIARTLTAWSH